ncbi:MAG: sialate O-acetylesterase [Phycisphaerae bacterium]|nr:sialate O-acetylesterase [Phycisphaerae bacterium]
MYRNLVLSCLLLALFSFGIVHAQDRPANMPREDVVEVPAIGKGLCVSNVFQANMVLQRDKPVTIWGWADPGEKVTVSFASQTAQTTANSDRSWKVTLKAMPANSTAQVMSIKSKSKAFKLENILIGDVWVLGGQSNMEFPISNIDDGELEIVSANFPQIRLLSMPVGKGFDSVKSFQRLYEWSSWSSRHFRKGDWDVCTPEMVKEFTAIGYVFGRRLQMATQVPIGLIDTSIGGTTVETWTPRQVLEKIKGKETVDLLQGWKEKIESYDPQADLQKQIDDYNNWVKKMKEQGKPIPADRKTPTEPRPGPAADKNRPGYCYASVIQPLEGLSVAGAVFHQGYNNCFAGSDGAKMYYQVFGEMITSWRSAFNDPQLPFGIISLCTGGDPQTMDNFLPPMYDAGALIREAQYKTFRDFYDAGDKNIGFVSSFDQRKSWYHPQIKVPVGERTAKWALVSKYEILKGSDYWLPPTIKEVKVTKDSIQLNMSTSIKTKDESDTKLMGFAIAGKDRLFYPAEVNWYTDGVRDSRNRLSYKKDILVLSSPFVPNPVHYRYAWARNPLANLTNSMGIPIATQRSDDWLLEETPVKVKDFENKNSRQISGELRKMLKEADIERRYKEAEATVAELKPIIEKANVEKAKKK